MSEWIKCSDQLPPLHVYVLGYYCGGNWRDSRDDPNREVVMRVDSRQSDPHDPNNRGVGYTWSTFGPVRHFGLDISHWTALPPPPEKT